MTTKLQLLVIGLLVLLSAPLCAVNVAAKGTWKVLFDGKSTDSWRGYKREDFPAKSWIIENGAIKTVVGAERVDLITKDKYRNFELELEWRVSPKGNSGIIYNVSEDLEQSWHTGLEMQVLDDGGHVDGKAPKTSAGALYALIAPTGSVLRPVGQFNKARLVVNNNRVEHWLNGKKVVEYTLGSDEVKGLIAQSKFKEFPRFAQEPGGHIGIQHHGEEVWYRKVRIRNLDEK